MRVERVVAVWVRASLGLGFMLSSATLATADIRPLTNQEQFDKRLKQLIESVKKGEPALKKANDEMKLTSQFDLIHQGIVWRSPSKFLEGMNKRKVTFTSQKKLAQSDDIELPADFWALVACRADALHIASKLKMVGKITVNEQLKGVKRTQLQKDSLAKLVLARHDKFLQDVAFLETLSAFLPEIEARKAIHRDDAEYLIYQAEGSVAYSMNAPELLRLRPVPSEASRKMRRLQALNYLGRVPSQNASNTSAPSMGSVIEPAAPVQLLPADSTNAASTINE